jgi:hypothetical protein
MKKRSLLYGFLAEFDTPEALIDCVRQAKEHGLSNIDAYTPFPVEGLAEALDHHSRVPLLVLAGGVIGLIAGAGMQYYSSVFDYPINIGSRPFNSWPSFVVVTFELTILFAGLSAVVGMLALNGLPKPYHPLFNEPRFERVTQDGFFFCVEATDPKFNTEQTWRFLEKLKPAGVYAVHDLPSRET